MPQAIQDRLASRDSAVRRQAIISLGKSGDRRALPLLARAYRDDPDPALRALAQKAGRFLKKELAAAEAAAAPARPVDKRYEAYIQAGYDDGTRDAPGYIVPVYDDDYDPTAEGYQVVEPPDTAPPLSDADRRKAADLAVRALEDYDRGRHVDSLNALIAALELNPRLKADPSVQKTAGGLTGQRGDEAVHILADPLRRQMYVGQVEDKAIQRAKKTGGVSWGDVLLDLVILMVVVMLGTVLGLWGMNTLLNDVMAVSGSLPPESLAVLEGLTTPMILLTGLLSGIGIAFWALILYGATHIVAGFFRGGASLTATLHALIPIQTALIVLSAVVGAAVALTGLVEIAWVLGGLVSFGGLLWQVAALSKVQGFGWTSGCAAIIVAVIVLGMFSAALSFIAASVLGRTLTALLPTTGLLLAF